MVLEHIGNVDCDKQFEAQDETYRNIMQKVSDERHRLTDDTEDDMATPGYSTSTPKRSTPKSRKRRQPTKTSIIWRHVAEDVLDSKKTDCNHCVKFWVNLKGSTSNPITHLRKKK